MYSLRLQGSSESLYSPGEDIQSLFYVTLHKLGYMCYIISVTLHVCVTLHSPLLQGWCTPVPGLTASRSRCRGTVTCCSLSYCSTAGRWLSTSTPGSSQVRRRHTTTTLDATTSKILRPIDTKILTESIHLLTINSRSREVTFKNH